MHTHTYDEVQRQQRQQRQDTFLLSFLLLPDIVLRFNYNRRGRWLRIIHAGCNLFYVLLSISTSFIYHQSGFGIKPLPLPLPPTLLFKSEYINCPALPFTSAEGKVGRSSSCCSHFTWQFKIDPFFLFSRCLSIQEKEGKKHSAAAAATIRDGERCHHYHHHRRRSSS